MANCFVLIGFVALLGSVHCVSECREKKMDIYFLLDSSNSIWIVYYRQMLQFVRDVVKQLDINDDFTRVGVVTFSDDYTRPPLALNRSHSQAQLLRCISELNLPYRTGLETNTHLVLKYVRENNEFRSSATKVMVVVTDGGSRQPECTAREAKLAHDKGFYVFVIGIGHYLEESEWRAIASKPYDRYIMNVTESTPLNYFACILPRRACSQPPIFVGC
ncbi:hypothetical protein RRG08_048691 [Elysia crispata]|uniref:VWFA domain-containing protein n=1 Tax=Elysia crispata TaxID=231223 RepID=A0AAE1DUP6_9GAST|nr:hypothetical protein RRG08_048691 [Elysia crispata]